MEKKYELPEVIEALNRAQEVSSIYHELEFSIHINGVAHWFTKYDFQYNETGYFVFILYCGNTATAMFTQHSLKDIY